MRRVAGSLVLVFGLISCRDSVPPHVEVPGSYRVQITSATAIGAIVFTASASSITSVQLPCSAPRCAFEQNGNTYRFVVTGTAAGGHAATISVSDTTIEPTLVFIEASGTSAQNYVLLGSGQVSLSAVLQP